MKFPRSTWPTTAASINLFLLFICIGLTHGEEDYEESEAGNGPVPRFLVSDEEIFAVPGEDVSFVCEVDNLGVYDIMFKEDPKSNAIISMGKKVFTPKYMSRVELIKLREDKGMTLVLKNVTSADSGTYVCVLNHPADNSTVTFHLVVGKAGASAAPAFTSDTGSSSGAAVYPFFTLFPLLMSLFLIYV